ncbi:hypothetical protein FG386_001203 [Cryptosporidium ryanae]|uniref:uncharacterized protein n=1 Tax=Cryptosporidium ryanae TaxID=515981 RepID=UPI00351A1D88|nr:hypothetical protein FG386_001203 [Cryptosporidium ryanae]
MKMHTENSVKKGNKSSSRRKSNVISNSGTSVLPEQHQLLSRCRFREFQLSLGNFSDFSEIDFEHRSILTFGIYLFENLLESVLCLGTALDKLHELECDIYSHLNEKREGSVNLSFKVINTEKKGFTLLPLEYKGLSNRRNSNSDNNRTDCRSKKGEDGYEDDQIIPPREYLELIGYKEPITRSYVFQFPYSSTPEELISEKCIVDLLKRNMQDDDWLRKLERVCSNISDLAKIILYLTVNYPITYKKFRKEREGGEVFNKLKNPLFYMATMKLLFDEYPNVIETGEKLNPKDPGDARRLVNRIRRNKLVGIRLLDINSKLLNSMNYVLRAVGGGSAWRCGSEYVQYYLHMSFVFDNSNMFSELSEKSFMFDHDIFEWNYTLNSLSQHIPLLNSFLRPLATSILANRVRNRISSINEYKNSLGNQENQKEKNSVLFPPLLGSSIEARFLTNEVIKRSKAFFGNNAGENLINSIKKEYGNWQYKSIIESISEKNGKDAIKRNSIKEYNQAVLVQEKKCRHVKSVISNALPPLSHFCSKNKNLQIKIAPGQKYVQSFYNNKISIPKNTVIE